MPRALAKRPVLAYNPDSTAQASAFEDDYDDSYEDEEEETDETDDGEDTP